ncbi:alpha/beta fold hydrolase [Mesorhizobium yinganensis]|uniref:alpha/beta fold hydrolase n=1 Tax=Mesorhizobium yinganensis TaxID=3157707 RepID=UPI0032B73B45
MLAYLAVTGKSHQREKLCEIFWEIPDDPRGALRWSLSKIRTVLGDEGDVLQSDRNAVALRANGSLDHARIAGLIGVELDGLSIDELVDAVRCIRGPFLADLYLDQSPTFEAWRGALASEVEILEVRLLRELVERLAGEPQRALAFAQRLHQLLPEDADIATEIVRLSDCARASAAHATVSFAPVRAAEHPIPATVMQSAAVKSSDRDREVRFCKARDGVRLAYAISGRGSPILRAAHWMSHLNYDWDSPIWRHWIKGLSENNTLVRYDERCNGLSEWNVADVSFHAMVSDLEHVADAAGLERFTLLGISQGCALSVAYAARHPERVSGLVLYGGYPKGWRARGDAGEIATREALATLMREGWGKSNPLFRQLFSSLFIKGAGPEHMASMDELQRRTMTPNDAWRLQQTFADIDISGLLSQISVPTLVLHARDDAVAPVESGRTLAVEIPGARFIELDSQNHILLEGEPAFEEFMGHLSAFVAATATRGLSLVRRRS